MTGELKVHLVMRVSERDMASAIIAVLERTPISLCPEREVSESLTTIGSEALLYHMRASRRRDE